MTASSSLIDATSTTSTDSPCSFNATPSLSLHACTIHPTGGRMMLPRVVHLTQHPLTMAMPFSVQKRCPASVYRTAGVLAALALSFAAPAAGSATTPPGWHVVKTATENADFAIKSASATIAQPRGLAVRLIGKVSNGNATVSCTSAGGAAAWNREWSHAGLFVLPMKPDAPTCIVVAAVAGSGRVTVQILRR